MLRPSKGIYWQTAGSPLILYGAAKRAGPSPDPTFDLGAHPWCYGLTDEEMLMDSVVVGQAVEALSQVNCWMSLVLFHFVLFVHMCTRHKSLRWFLCQT